MEFALSSSRPETSSFVPNTGEVLHFPIPCSGSILKPHLSFPSLHFLLLLLKVFSLRLTALRGFGSPPPAHLRRTYPPRVISISSTYLAIAHARAFMLEASSGHHLAWAHSSSSASLRRATATCCREHRHRNHRVHKGTRISFWPWAGAAVA